MVRHKKVTDMKFTAYADNIQVLTLAGTLQNYTSFTPSFMFLTRTLVAML